MCVAMDARHMEVKLSRKTENSGFLKAATWIPDCESAICNTTHESHTGFFFVQLQYAKIKRLFPTRMEVCITRADLQKRRQGWWGSPSPIWGFLNSSKMKESSVICWQVCSNDAWTQVSLKSRCTELRKRDSGIPIELFPYDFLFGVILSHTISFALHYSKQRAKA